MAILAHCQPGPHQQSSVDHRQHPAAVMDPLLGVSCWQLQWPFCISSTSEPTGHYTNTMFDLLQCLKNAVSFVFFFWKSPKSLPLDSGVMLRVL